MKKATGCIVRVTINMSDKKLFSYKFTTTLNFSSNISRQAAKKAYKTGIIIQLTVYVCHQITNI